MHMVQTKLTSTEIKINKSKKARIDGKCLVIKVQGENEFGSSMVHVVGGTLPK